MYVHCDSFSLFSIFLRLFIQQQTLAEIFFESIEKSRDIRQQTNNSIESLVIIFGLFIQHFPGVIRSLCVCMWAGLRSHLRRTLVASSRCCTLLLAVHHLTK